MSEPADNCGACTTEARAITVHPWRVVAVGIDGVRAWYRCPGCGYRWWTSWLLGVEETERVLSQAGAA